MSLDRVTFPSEPFTNSIRIAVPTGKSSSGSFEGQTQPLVSPTRREGRTALEAPGCPQWAWSHSHIPQQQQDGACCAPGMFGVAMPWGQGRALQPPWMWNWNLQLPERPKEPWQVSGQGAALPVPGPEGAWAVPREWFPLGTMGHSQEAVLEPAAALVLAMGTGLAVYRGLLAMPGLTHICCCHHQAGGAALISPLSWLEQVLVGTTTAVEPPEHCPNSSLGNRTPQVVFVPSTPRLPRHHGRYSSNVLLLLGLLPSRFPQVALPASISLHHPSLLPPTARFPLQVTVVKVSGLSFPSLGAARDLPSVPSLPLSLGPVQLHTGSHQLVPVTTMQGSPDALGQVVHLPQLVQLPLGAAVCPPAYDWVQQVVMGRLLCQQPRAVVQEEALYPLGSSTFHIHHQPALTLPAGTTTMEPEGKLWGWQSPPLSRQAKQSFNLFWFHFQKR